MVLTTYYLNQIRTEVKDDIEALSLYCAIGTSSTTPTTADTSLGSEVFRDAIDEVDKSSAVDTIVLSLRVLTTEANGNTIQETGLFEVSAAGTAQSHDLLTSITKTNDIQLYIDHSMEITVTED